MKVLLDSMLKTQSKDRSFIADAGLKGTGFLFRFLNKLKMLGVFIFLPFAGVETMSAFFASSLSGIFHSPSEFVYACWCYSNLKCDLLSYNSA